MANRFYAGGGGWNFTPDPMTTNSYAPRSFPRMYTSLGGYGGGSGGGGLGGGGGSQDLPEIPYPFDPSFAGNDALNTAITRNQAADAFYGRSGMEQDEIPWYRGPIVMGALETGGKVLNPLDMQRQALYGGINALLKGRNIIGGAKEQLRKGMNLEDTLDFSELLAAAGWGRAKNKGTGVWWGDNGGGLEGALNDVGRVGRSAATFLGNILTDPVTYETMGIGALAKGGAAGLSGGATAARVAATNATAGTARTAASLVDDAVRATSDDALRAARIAATESADDVIRRGGTVATNLADPKVSAMRQTIAEAREKAAQAAAREARGITWRDAAEQAWGSQGVEQMAGRAPKAYGRVANLMDEPIGVAEDMATGEAQRVMRDMGRFATQGQSDFGRLGIQIPFTRQRHLIPGVSRKLGEVMPYMGDSQILAKLTPRFPGSFKSNQVMTGSRLGAQVFQDAKMMADAGLSAGKMAEAGTAANIADLVREGVEEVKGYNRFWQGGKREEATGRLLSLLGVAKEQAKKAPGRAFIADDFIDQVGKEVVETPRGEAYRVADELIYRSDFKTADEWVAAVTKKVKKKATGAANVANAESRAARVAVEADELLNTPTRAAATPKATAQPVTVETPTATGTAAKTASTDWRDAYDGRAGRRGDVTGTFRKGTKGGKPALIFKTEDGKRWAYNTEAKLKANGGQLDTVEVPSAIGEATTAAKAKAATATTAAPKAPAAKALPSRKVKTGVDAGKTVYPVEYTTEFGNTKVKKLWSQKTADAFVAKKNATAPAAPRAAAAAADEVVPTAEIPSRKEYYALPKREKDAVRAKAGFKKGESYDAFVARSGGAVDDITEQQLADNLAKVEQKIAALDDAIASGASGADNAVTRESLVALRADITDEIDELRLAAGNTPLNAATPVEAVQKSVVSAAERTRAGQRIKLQSQGVKLAQIEKQLAATQDDATRESLQGQVDTIKAEMKRARDFRQKTVTTSHTIKERGKTFSVIDQETDEVAKKYYMRTRMKDGDIEYAFSEGQAPRSATVGDKWYRSKRQLKTAMYDHFSKANPEKAVTKQRGVFVTRFNKKQIVRLGDHIGFLDDSGRELPIFAQKGEGGRWTLSARVGTKRGAKSVVTLSSHLSSQDLLNNIDDVLDDALADERVTAQFYDDMNKRLSYNSHRRWNDEYKPREIARVERTPHTPAIDDPATLQFFPSDINDYTDDELQRVRNALNGLGIDSDALDEGQVAYVLNNAYQYTQDGRMVKLTPEQLDDLFDENGRILQVKNEYGAPTLPEQEAAMTVQTAAPYDVGTPGKPVARKLRPTTEEMSQYEAEMRGELKTLEEQLKLVDDDLRYGTAELSAAKGRRDSRAIAEAEQGMAQMNRRKQSLARQIDDSRTLQRDFYGSEAMRRPEAAIAKETPTIGKIAIRDESATGVFLYDPATNRWAWRPLEINENTDELTREVERLQKQVATARRAEISAGKKHTSKELEDLVDKIDRHEDPSDGFTMNLREYAKAKKRVKDLSVAAPNKAELKKQLTAAEQAITDFDGTKMSKSMADRELQKLKTSRDAIKAQLDTAGAPTAAPATKRVQRELKQKMRKLELAKQGRLIGDEMEFLALGEGQLDMTAQEVQALFTPEGSVGFLERVADEVNPRDMGKRFREAWMREGGDHLPVSRAAQREMNAAEYGTSAIDAPFTPASPVVYPEPRAGMFGGGQMKPTRGQATQNLPPLYTGEKLTGQLAVDEGEQVFPQTELRRLAPNPESPPLEGNPLTPNFSRGQMTFEAERISSGPRPGRIYGMGGADELPTGTRQATAQTVPEGAEYIPMVTEETAVNRLKDVKDIEGNTFSMNRAPDGGFVEVKVTDTDGGESILGKFEDEDLAREYVNLASKGIEDKKNMSWLVDEDALDEAIADLVKKTGWFSDSDLPQLRAIGRTVLEAERDMLDEQGLRENLAGITHEMLGDYSPGYAPKGKMSKDTKTLMKAIGVDPDDLDAEFVRKTGGSLADEVPLDARYSKDIEGAFQATQPTKKGYQHAKENPQLTRRAKYEDIPFEPNIATRAGARVGMGTTDIAREQALNSLGQMFGRPIEKFFDQEAGEWVFKSGDRWLNAQALTKQKNSKLLLLSVDGSSAYQMPSVAIADSVKNAIFAAPKEANLADKLMSSNMLPFMLSAKPAHILTNTLGNIDFALRNGHITPSSMVEARRVLKAFRDYTKHGVIPRGLKVQGQLLEGDDAVGFVQQLVGDGVLSPKSVDPMFAAYTRDFENALPRAASIKDWPGMKQYLDVMQTANSNSENLFRAATWLSASKQGMARGAANAETNRVMLNYFQSALTPIEQKIRRWVPFYTWSRRNIPASAELIADRPGFAYNMYSNGPMWLSESSEQDENGVQLDMSPREYIDRWQDMPANMRENVAAPIFYGNQDYLSTRVPMNDINPYAEIVREGKQMLTGEASLGDLIGQTQQVGASQLGPFVKTGVEGLTGVDMETGAPIGQEEDPASTWGAAAIGNIPIIGQLIRGAQEQQKFADYAGTKGNQRGVQDAVDSLLAQQRPRPVDLPRWDRQWEFSNKRVRDAQDARYQEETGMMPANSETDFDAYIDMGLSRAKATPDDSIRKRAAQIEMIMALSKANKVDIPMEQKIRWAQELWYDKENLPLLAMQKDVNGQVPMSQYLPQLSHGPKYRANDIPEQMKRTLFEASTGLGIPLQFANIQGRAEYDDTMNRTYGAQQRLREGR